MEKDSFILYTYQAETISDLSLEQKGVLLTALYEYASGEQPEITDQAVKVAFKSIRVQIEKDNKKYTDVCEKRRKAANNRWQNDAKPNKTMQNKTKRCKTIQNDAKNANANFAYANDYDNEYDNDIIIDDNNKKEIYKEKVVGAVAPTPKQKNIESLEKRKNNFIETLTEYRTIYGNEMVEDFISYWTEPNKSKTKMRFELEKTWDVARRLSTWCKNQSRFNYGNNRQNNSADAARIKREQEYAALMQKYLQ